MQVLHTALLVTDLERARQFYEQGLGLTPTQRSLSFPGVWYQVGQQQIHLIQADQVPTAHHPLWGRRPHLALGIPQWQELLDRLLALGYEIQHSHSGRPAFFVQDPDGNVIECSRIQP
ncbi:MAG: VOC family protein [Thermostichales cyanobacterium SZTDM-1c_bins_54]